MNSSRYARILVLAYYKCKEKRDKYEYFLNTELSKQENIIET